MQIHKFRQHRAAYLPDGVGGIMLHRTILRPISDPRKMIGHGIPVIRRRCQRQAEHYHPDYHKNSVIRHFLKCPPSAQPCRPHTFHTEHRCNPQLLKLYRQKKQQTGVPYAPYGKEKTETQGVSHRQYLCERKKKKHPQTTCLNVRTKTYVHYALPFFINMNIPKQSYRRKQHANLLYPALPIMGNALNP